MANVFKTPDQRKKWNAYNNAYAQKNYKTVTLKLNKTKDKDILDFIDANGSSATTLFKQLVREKIGSK